MSKAGQVNTSLLKNFFIIVHSAHKLSQHSHLALCHILCVQKVKYYFPIVLDYFFMLTAAMYIKGNSSKSKNDHDRIN